MLEHVQCLLLVESGGRSNARSRARHSSIRSASVYALLPQIFKDLCPEIRQFFSKNNIQIVDKSTKPKEVLATSRTFNIFEIKLANVNVKTDIVEPVVHIDKTLKEPTRLIFSKSATNIHWGYLSSRSTYSAIDEENIEFIKTCLALGATFDYAHRDGGTGLHFAAIQTSLRLLKLFLKKGYAVNAVQSNGWTPLHHASTRGNIQFVKALVQHGADVNARAGKHHSVADSVGLTPLLMATRLNHTSVVKFLVSNGADVNAADHCECKYPTWWGAPSHNLTPLHLAADEGHLDVLETLIQVSGKISVKVRTRGIGCSTPLMFAARNGNLEIVKCLLSKGANVDGLQDSEESEGNTALHLAVARGRLSVVKFLVRQGADINARAANGRTPLLSAIESFYSDWSLDIIEFLIEAGADIKAAEPLNILISALYLSQNVAELIVSRHSELSNDSIVDAIYFALVKDNASCNKYFNKICPPDFIFDNDKLQNSNMTALLFGAIRKNRVDLVEQLLKKGASVITPQCVYGPIFATLSEIPALHWAAATATDGKLLQILIDYGADVNFADSDGKTPVLHAVSNNNCNALKVLLKNNARIRGDRRLLPEAVKWSNAEVVEMLLINGADVNTELLNPHQEGPTDIVSLTLITSSVPVLKVLLKFGITDPLKIWIVIADEIYFDRRYERKFQKIVLSILIDCWNNSSVIWEILRRCHSDAKFRKCSLDTGMYLVKMYFARKLTFVNLEVLFRELEDPRLKQFDVEIEMMQNEIIANSEVYLHDILTCSEDRIVKYLRNPSIFECLKTASYTDRYPLYGDILEWVIEKALHRRYLLTQGVKIFTNLFSQFSKLPDELKEKIVGLLENEDLQMLLRI